VDVLTECEAEGLSWTRRAARLTRRMCEAEKVVIEPGQRIAYMRTIRDIPPLYRPEQWERMAAGRTLHELGPISNICADWGMVLSEGLLGRRAIALGTRRRMHDDPEAVEFLDAAVETIDAVLGLAGRYARAADESGRDDLARTLRRVPAERPGTFHEALQFVRFCHAIIWLSGHYHVTLGRFDQYMWPYLRDDLASGRLTVQQAEELLAEFFIAFNRDSDLCYSVQQGDNGQSLMLGGVRRDGSNAVNALTRMALRVARDVAMIDPKINLRIAQHTDLELLTLAAKLTRIGLGFPQYANDDVVIPALLAHGYDIEDARDYTVAACWEFIIPGKAMDVVNIGAVSMPAAVDVALREGLPSRDGFEAMLERVAADISDQLDTLVNAYSRLLLPPAPWYSVLMDGPLESGCDLSQGLKYNNFGIHGACAASAADALAAVKTFVFDEGSVDRAELANALLTDYENDEPLRRRLSETGPKVGNNDDRADAMLVWLFEVFADACERVRDNGRGGIVRPGSGSAMYYLWFARPEEFWRERAHERSHDLAVGATADGRKAGEPFSANLAPSAGVRVRGPVSVLQSFSKIDYRRICNGGPITMELTDTVFRDEEALRKVAMLVRAFARLGGQQLQVNTLKVDALIDAKTHPERHRNLIVRVWGWSGYFCELDEAYQDQIIARHRYAL
jgi:formate C-acetyltransferase